MRLPSHSAALACVLAAVAAMVLALAQEPSRGLVRQTFSDEAFQHEQLAPELDARVYFASDDPAHPVPSWLGHSSSARYEGFLEAPRSGRYVVQLVSDDGAQLFLDGVRVLDNGGVHPPRAATRDLTLSKGFHPLRIEYVQSGGGGTLRLEWRLPSGYNTLGLVPVSSLFPVVPPLIGLGTRALRLAPWVLAALAFVLWRRRSIGAFLGRVREDAGLRGAVLLGCAVTLGALAVRLYDLAGMGETCDEWAYVGAGRIYANNLATLNFDPEQWKANREHPAVGKLIWGAVQYVFGDADRTTRATAAVLGALTVGVTFLAARRLFGTTVAALSGLVLALVPSFIAHGKIPALDTPAAFFFTLTMWLLLRALQEPASRNRAFLWAALAGGLGLATKLSNGLLVPLLVLTVPLLKWREIRVTGEVRLPWAVWAMPVLLFVPFVATWPWLWGDSLNHLLESIRHWGHPPAELFLGRVLQPVPRTYFLVAFFAVMPVLLAPVLGIGLWRLARLRNVIPDGALGTRATYRALMLLWLMLPFAWSFAGFRQDGIRYVYAAFPPFAIVVALGLAALGDLAKRAAPLVYGAFAVYLALTAARIHPWYLDYYNEVVGGPTGAYQERLFETGWWGEGLSETVAWMNAHAPDGATWDFRGLVNHTEDGLRDDLRQSASRPDFLIRTDFAPGNERTPGYEQAFVVKAGEAPLAAVYRREGVALRD